MGQYAPGIVPLQVVLACLSFGCLPYGDLKHQDPTCPVSHTQWVVQSLDSWARDLYPCSIYDEHESTLAPLVEALIIRLKQGEGSPPGAQCYISSRSRWNFLSSLAISGMHRRGASCEPKLGAFACLFVNLDMLLAESSRCPCCHNRTLP
jgi:hypothetical protein